MSFPPKVGERPRVAVSGRNPRRRKAQTSVTSFGGNLAHTRTWERRPSKGMRGGARGAKRSIKKLFRYPLRLAIGSQ